MPRPNPPRRVGAERHVARRIAYERKARGWSIDALADRMTQIGCAIQGSAIYKTESGEPPRRITLDEAVAYAKVFDLELAEFLWPVEVVEERRLERLLGQLRDVSARHHSATAAWYLAWREVYRLAADDAARLAAVDSYADLGARVNNAPGGEVPAAMWESTEDHLDAVRQLALRNERAEG